MVKQLMCRCFSCSASFFFFFLIYDGFICSSPSTRLLTWSRFDLRLQPKDPIVASEFCHSSIWLYIFCMWRAFALQNLRALLVLFTAVLFRILPVPSECIKMLFDTLAAFLKDTASHVVCAACPNPSRFHGYP